MNRLKKRFLFKFEAHFSEKNPNLAVINRRSATRSVHFPGRLLRESCIYSWGLSGLSLRGLFAPRISELRVTRRHFRCEGRPAPLVPEQVHLVRGDAHSGGRNGKIKIKPLIVPATDSFNAPLDWTIVLDSSILIIAPTPKGQRADGCRKRVHFSNERLSPPIRRRLNLKRERLRNVCSEIDLNWRHVSAGSVQFGECF
ncbi:hypothetical protein CDAR_603431 [Caerostris darwini]|uniref:Uncharacterized protein n=1 Tax=Caerostris darwini TaxID=1538125 RepID=A0AAV4T8M4_9ARAC|nr:hypothetical protein CDAR_603431 [Caerostris darwini]